MILSAGHAGVAKLAYAQDLKSCGPKGPYGFDPRLLHQFSMTYSHRFVFSSVPTGLVVAVVVVLNAELTHAHPIDKRIWELDDN